jgi:signal transduction histidine kinase
MATAEANPRTFHASAERCADEVVRADALAFVADGPLAAVLDAIPSLVLVLNAQRQVIFANAAAQRIAATFGTTPVLGRRPGEVLACRNVADAPSGCGTGRACRTCGAVNALVEALHGRPATDECRIGTRRGDALDLRATATPFRWGGREYALLVLDDVSDAKRRAVLERTFFHDLLNTAGGVSGIAGLIVADPDACREFRHDLLTSATQLVNEIKCQRMLFSAEQGELVVERVPTGSRRLLDDARQLYAHHPVAEGRRLEVAPDTDDVALTTDPAVVGRVLGNLVKNALEASAPGEAVVIAGARDRRRLRAVVPQPRRDPARAPAAGVPAQFLDQGRGARDRHVQRAAADGAVPARSRRLHVVAGGRHAVHGGVAPRPAAAGAPLTTASRRVVVAVVGVGDVRVRVDERRMAVRVRVGDAGRVVGGVVVPVVLVVDVHVVVFERSVGVFVVVALPEEHGDARGHERHAGSVGAHGCSPRQRRRRGATNSADANSTAWRAAPSARAGRGREDRPTPYASADDGAATGARPRSACPGDSEPSWSRPRRGTNARDRDRVLADRRCVRLLSTAQRTHRPRGPQVGGAAGVA